MGTPCSMVIKWTLGISLVPGVWELETNNICSHQKGEWWNTNHKSLWINPRAGLWNLEPAYLCAQGVCSIPLWIEKTELKISPEPRNDPDESLHASRYPWVFNHQIWGKKMGLVRTLNDKEKGILLNLASAWSRERIHNQYAEVRTDSPGRNQGITLYHCSFLPSIHPCIHWFNQETMPDSMLGAQRDAKGEM